MPETCQKTRGITVLPHIRTTIECEARQRALTLCCERLVFCRTSCSRFLFTQELTALRLLQFIRIRCKVTVFASAEVHAIRVGIIGRRSTASGPFALLYIIRLRRRAQALTLGLHETRTQFQTVLDTCCCRAKCAKRQVRCTTLPAVCCGT